MEQDATKWTREINSILENRFKLELIERGLDRNLTCLFQGELKMDERKGCTN